MADTSENNASSSRRAAGRVCAALLLSALAAPSTADELENTKIDELIAAYPDQKLRRENGVIVWPDGTRMPFDDGKGEKSFDAWLADPDLEDMLRLPYPAGQDASAPTKNSDPGRARNAAFFDKMYGKCEAGAVTGKLKRIAWLPRKGGGHVEITTVNGVADQLEAVSKALDDLPASFDKYLMPVQGTYNCRMIAGTSRPSAHGHGIAMDIATRHSSYWRWSAPDAEGRYPYKNEIPLEIVSAFEAAGFIWGGRWYHYDTMHFEYRPELLPRARPEGAAAPSQEPAPRGTE